MVKDEEIPHKEEKSTEEINERPLEVLEQNAKALDELVEDKAENQLDPNEDMEIVEPPEEEEVDIDDEKPLVDI